MFTALRQIFRPMWNGPLHPIRRCVVGAARAATLRQRLGWRASLVHSFGFSRDLHVTLPARYLRGHGIEVGAGNTPTQLPSGTTASLAEVDPTLKYGGRFDQIFSLDDCELLDRVGSGKYDFAIASHVLEHLDSAIRGFENLIKLAKLGGYIYIAVPDIAGLHDVEWMPCFPLAHHIEEYTDPIAYADLHDSLVANEHARLYGQGPLLPRAEERFMHHKHTYDMAGWEYLLGHFNTFLGEPARLVDKGYGWQRRDCNFIFQRQR